MTLVFKEQVTNGKKDEYWGIKRSDLAACKVPGHSKVGVARKIELKPEKKKN